MAAQSCMLSTRKGSTPSSSTSTEKVTMSLSREEAGRFSLPLLLLVASVPPPSLAWRHSRSKTLAA